MSAEEWTKVTASRPKTFPKNGRRVEMFRWVIDRWMSTVGTVRQEDNDPRTTTIDKAVSVWAEEIPVGFEVNRDAMGAQIETIYWKYRDA